MPKRKAEKFKPVTSIPEEAIYEMPDEFDFGRLRHVGTGIEAIQKDHAAKSAASRTVELAPDIAEAFPTAAAVDEALRAVMHAAKRLGQAGERASA